MRDKQIGVAIIGCGNIAGAYAKNLAAYPEIKLLGATDIDLQRAESLAQQYGGQGKNWLDAVPGESNKTWFKADRTGEFDGQSYAFSGAGYAAMRTRVTVVEVPAYEAWLEEHAAGIQEAQAYVQKRNAGD